MEIDVLGAADGSLQRSRMAVTRRARWAWYFYDFGNSAYAAVVLLAVYSAYFKQQVVGGAEGTRLWGLSVGIAMLVVAILSPVLGVLADFSAAKKRVLLVFSCISWFFTAMLFFVQQGDIFMGMAFFILAEIGYRGAQVFYNALLPDIAEPEKMGEVSGNGWAIGSLGGILCLALVLGLILTVKGELILRASFLITAAFYFLATLPVFLFVKERARPQTPPPGENYITISMQRLWMTYKTARQHKEFFKFLVSFMLYNNGIMMTLDFAAIIGAVMYGLNQQQLILFMMIVQVTSVIGAFCFGYLTRRSGSRVALIASLVLMMLTIAWLFLAHSPLVFHLIGALAGFALTGVQSVSRTVVGQVCPPEKSAEFYGLFSVVGQLSNFTGPALYGLLATALALRYYQPRGLSAHAAEVAGMEMALLAIIAFLGLGLAALLSVKSWRRAE